MSDNTPLKLGDPGFLDSLVIDEDGDDEDYDTSRKFSNLRDYPGMSGFSA